MTELIACLGAGKGTWGHVARLIEGEDWEKVFLVTNEFGREKFSGKAEFIVVDGGKGLRELTEEIRKVLAEKLMGMEVAINLVSGSGKEHMALLGAVMKLGIGFRLMALTREGVKEI